MWQPFPKFYIFRPDGRQVPLIPIDELPSWIRIGFMDWNNPSLYQFMIPATTSLVPREGEYDAMCQYCLNSVDNTLHRSASELSTDAEEICPSSASHIPQKNARSLSALEIASLVPRTVDDIQGGTALSCSPEAGKLYPATSPFLLHPPFYSNLQSPYVGMCFAQCLDYMKRFFYKPQPLNDESSTDSRRGNKTQGQASQRQHKRRNPKLSKISLNLEDKQDRLNHKVQWGLRDQPAHKDRQVHPGHEENEGTGVMHALHGAGYSVIHPTKSKGLVMIATWIIAANGGK
ncbi:hypothetical protein BJX64DRAFT_287790 [Aspergillus heterothallicus]